MVDVEPIFRQVLLIEDDPSHALLIKRALRGVVGEVHHAVTLRDGFEFLEHTVPNVIISDLHLPDAGAEGPLADLHGRNPEIPIIVLTSSTSLHEAVDAMKQGARDFVIKDFDANFREVISLALARVAKILTGEVERERLLRENALLRVSIENNQDGLALIDISGGILYANRPFGLFAARCGKGAQSLPQLFDDSVVANSPALMDSLRRNLETLADGGVFTTAINFVKEKTTAFELSLSALPVPGNRTFAVWVRDRSAQKQREKFQREILSTTTHDLKGPLGAILISSEMLTTALASHGREKELALRIGSSAQGAINLIDEFLSARRIQEGTFILRPSMHEIGQLMRDAAGDFETIAAARSVKLTVQPAASPLELFIDRLGFVRVVSNLLSNAIKFTPKGGSVTLSCFGLAEEVHVAISDSGCGMEPSEVNSLFERFARLDKHSDVAGSGLGLFVVRSIVTAHGGRIDVTSRVGQGTTFDVVFPKQPPVNERGELISLNFA